MDNSMERTAVQTFQWTNFKLCLRRPRIDGTRRYRQNYRNDLVIKWLESIRSNQITSVIKESVCEATKLEP
jgi:hypothetical protein